MNSSIAHFDRAAAVFIGAELRAERKRGKLPIDYANMACGLAKSSVSHIERGLVDVSLSNYVGLCEVYGVNAADLLQRALRVRNAKREKGEKDA